MRCPDPSLRRPRHEHRAPRPLEGPAGPPAGHHSRTGRASPWRGSGMRYARPQRHHRSLGLDRPRQRHRAGHLRHADPELADCCWQGGAVRFDTGPRCASGRSRTSAATSRARCGRSVRWASWPARGGIRRRGRRRGHPWHAAQHRGGLRDHGVERRPRAGRLQAVAADGRHRPRRGVRRRNPGVAVGPAAAAQPHRRVAGPPAADRAPSGAHAMDRNGHQRGLLGVLRRRRSPRLPGALRRRSVASPPLSWRFGRRRTWAVILCSMRPAASACARSSITGGLVSLGLASTGDAALLALTSRLWLTVLEILPGLVALLLASIAARPVAPRDG